MKLIKTLLILAISLALPSFGYSHSGGHDSPNRPAKQQTISLDQSDIRSLNNRGRLGLKKALKNVITVNQNSKLVEVTVTGRARGNMSMVTLKVGGNTVDTEYLENHRRGPRHHRGDHDRRHRPRASTVTLNNQQRYSDGAWVLNIDRDVKASNVTVTIKKDRRNGNNGDHRHSQIKLGSYKVDKFVTDSKTFHVSHRNVDSITLQCQGNSVDVKRIWVTYSDGQSERLRRLEGRIGQNRSQTVQLNGYKNNIVRSVTVEAISRKLNGSRASLVVYAGLNDSRDDRRDDRRRRR